MAPGPNIDAAATLRHLATDTTLLLSTMHMKAKTAQDMEDLRARQIRQLLDVVQERAAAKADAVLITGDFNTDPYDAPKQTARCPTPKPPLLRPPLRASANELLLLVASKRLSLP